MKNIPQVLSFLRLAIQFLSEGETEAAQTCLTLALDLFKIDMVGNHT